MIIYIYYWSLLFLDNVINIIKSWAYFDSAWSRLEQTKVVCTHVDIYNLPWAYFESAWSRLEQTRVVCTHVDIYNIYFYQYKQMIMMLCYAMDQIN